MELVGAITSPYTRKILLLLHEAGLQEEVKFKRVKFASDMEYIAKLNPLRQIPFLVDEDGTATPESDLIAKYLSVRFSLAKIFPTSFDRDFNVYLAYINGAIDAAVDIIREYRKPHEKLDVSTVDKYKLRIKETLEFVDKNIEIIKQSPLYLQIVLGAATGYLEFRHPDLHSLESTKGLDKWFREFSARPSMKATIPFD
jgi:glutathione S-transferase